MPANKSMGERSYVFDSEHYLSTNHILMIGMIATFALDLFFTGASVFLLPSDQGRAFAVNGSLSKGKLWGLVLFVLKFLISAAALFLPLDVEYMIYGFYCLNDDQRMPDDASKTPWNEYKSD